MSTPLLPSKPLKLKLPSKPLQHPKVTTSPQHPLSSPRPLPVLTPMGWEHRHICMQFMSFNNVRSQNMSNIPEVMQSAHVLLFLDLPWQKGGMTRVIDWGFGGNGQCDHQACGLLHWQRLLSTFSLQIEKLGHLCWLQPPSPCPPTFSQCENICTVEKSKNLWWLQHPPLCPPTPLKAYRMPLKYPMYAATGVMNIQNIRTIPWKVC